MKKLIPAAVAVAALSVPLVACSPAAAEEKTSYDIVAALSEDNTLTATVTCDYVNNTESPLDELWFHLYPNAYREGAKYAPVPADKNAEAYPGGKSYATLDITSVTVDGESVESAVSGGDSDILSVPLGATLQPTERTSVKIDYTLKLPRVRHRLGYNSKTVNLCNFYPIACVYRDGAFVADPYYAVGDPFFSECADYTVTFTAPAKYTCAFTGSVDSKKEGEDAYTYTVKADSVRDFAAVLGEFTKASGLAGTTVVNYYYYADSEPERALNTAIDAINTFGELFGSYPYPEYSVVQTEFIHGGMEYPCLSLISGSYVGDAYCDVIVHETAHQWWYAAVGNDEVKYPWLDEGLAEYSTMLFYERNDGYKYTFNGKRGDALTAYMLYCERYKNNGLGDTSMTRTLADYTSDTEYSYMNYVKGALMLDDVRNTIGDAAFMSGLKTYYSGCKFGIAKPEDLIGALEKASKRTLDPLFTSWLDGNVKLYSKN